MRISAKAAASGLMGAVVMLSGCGHRAAQPPPAQGFFGQWMQIDAPVRSALQVGDMWDGTQAYRGCFAVDSIAVDTGQTQRSEIGSASKEAGFGAKLLNRVGLSAARSRARSWTLRGWGTRVAIAYGLRPNPTSSCALKDGLPKFTAIASMIAFDSLSLEGTDASGSKLQLDSTEIAKVIATTGAIATKDSLKFAFTSTNLWVGYHLFGIDQRKKRTCGWQQPLRQYGQCKDEAIPLRLRVDDLRTGSYVLTIEDPRIPNFDPVIDTVAEGQQLSSGVAVGRSGTLGEWYGITVHTTPVLGEVRIEVTKRDYEILRFTDESRREAWRQWIRSR